MAHYPLEIYRATKPLTFIPQTQMIPFLEKIFGHGGAIATALGRFRKRASHALVSKDQNPMRESAGLSTPDWKAKEAERLDRLRNPRNYQGR